MKLNKVLVAVAVVAATVAADAKTIGIWKDKRVGNLSGPVNTLTNAGWNVVWLTEGVRGKKGHDLENAATLEKCDVVYFPGGWGRYFFPSAKARKTVIRYAASGGGALVTAFRGGYTRTANRPMFPEVAEVYNRLSSSWIFPSGNSEIAKAFGGKAVSAGSGDHLTIKVGPKGTVFAENSGDPVGALGDFGEGRVIVYGGHFSYSPGDDTSADNDRLLLAMVDYLSSRGKPSPDKAAKAADKAEASFIRRERMWDLTLDERGPDRAGGIIPTARNRAIAIPESLAYKLEYFAGFLDKSDAKKCRAAADAMLKKSKAVIEEAAKMKREAEAKLKAMDVKELNAFSITGSQWNAEAVVEKFAKIVDTNSFAAVEALVAEMSPKVLAAKSAALDRELKEDLKSVPSLVKKTASKCAKERREAAMELGRIQPTDKESLNALVGLLDDADQDVRAQAAISLGWMQAKGAVDALVAKTTSKNARDRRRAVQALGMIGDKRAAPALMKALDDPDSYVKQIAEISLGYVKAETAVPRLLSIAEDKKAGEQAREAAILALGFIGDKSVVPVLERLKAEAGDDGPKMKSRSKATPVGNPFSYGTHAMAKCTLGIGLSAKTALEDIANGGRKEPGVRQNKFRRGKDLFYAVTGNCNALAGRIANGNGSFAYKDRKYLLAHLKEAGCTGVHFAWGHPGWSTAAYKEFLREADELGLICIDTLPGYTNAGIPETAFRFDRLSEFACLSGFWAEETWPEPGISSSGFLAAIKRRFGENWRETSGLTAEEIAEVDRIVAAGYSWMSFGNVANRGKGGESNFDAPWNGRLRSLVLEIDGEVLVNAWRESQDFLHGARMGFAQTFVVSTADPVRFPSDGAACATLDSIGVETYQSFGRSTAYFMQRYRDGEGRSTMSELYNWYCPSNEHALRGFWQNAIHSKCFFNFGLHHIFKYASSEYLWNWEEGRWDKFREVFRRVAANREFYRIVPSAANVAVLYSARTPGCTKVNAYQPCPVPLRVDQNAMAVWVALGQKHIPADVVYADAIAPEKLSKYAVVYLPDSKFLGPKDIATLREWVRAGGVLVAEAGTSLFDGETLVLRKDYALADVFGVKYEGTDFLPDDQSDTFCRRRGLSISAFKFVGDLNQRFHLEDSIHRDLKPSKGVVSMKFGEAASECLPGIKAGDRMEIDAALGIDRVKPTTAREIAAFPDGRGAMFVNEFGKGRCYFFASQYPLMGHVTSEWEMMPNKFVFWGNVAETLEAAVKGGFAKRGVTPPVEVANAGPEVEVTVDDQGSRYVVHLLDYDVRSKGVKGASLTVPGTRPIKRVWYPDTGTELKLDGRTAKLRDFRPYDMVAVEFE